MTLQGIHTNATLERNPVAGNQLAPPVGEPDIGLKAYPNKKILFIIALHVLLGAACHMSAWVATAHAYFVGVVALFYVVSNASLRRFLLIAAYTSSGEVLWRMSHAAIPWMYAEYLVLFIVIFGFIRLHGNRKTLFLPLYYVISLLPSIILTLFDRELGYGRELIVFNLAGPVAIGLGMFAVSRFTVHVKELSKPILYAVFPVVSIVAITVVAVYLEGVQYIAVSASNKAASGGYAPNQVSSIISFGAVILVMLIVFAKDYHHARFIFSALLVIFVVQMLLTLSRGGTLSLIAFLLFGLPFFFKTRRGRQQFILILVGMTAIMWMFLLPALDVFTGGALHRRYNDESTTSRTLLMEEELNAFADSPLLGHGPGNSSHYRVLHGKQTAASHTEYTRVLADHGIIGGIGMVLLALTFVHLFFVYKEHWKRGAVLGSAAWIYSYFAHSASRTVTFAFLGILAVLIAHSYTDETHHEEMNDAA